MNCFDFEIEGAGCAEAACEEKIMEKIFCEKEKNIMKERNKLVEEVLRSLELVGLGFVDKNKIQGLTNGYLENINITLWSIEENMDELFGLWGDHENYSDNPMEFTERLQDILHDIYIDLIGVRNDLGIKDRFQESSLKVLNANKDKIKNQIKETDIAIDTPSFPEKNCHACGSKNINRKIEQIDDVRLSHCICLECENSWFEEPEVKIKTLKNRRARLMRKVKKLKKEIKWVEDPSSERRDRKLYIPL